MGLSRDAGVSWCRHARSKPVVVDSAFSSEKKELLRVNYNRSIPTAFKLYHGEAWVILSRAFSEYMIFGYDNFARTLLLYYANFVSSPEHYFHTLICNSGDFNSTVANTDLRYIRWGNEQHPKTLSNLNFPRFVGTGDAFARKFQKDSKVLRKIDRVLLRRESKQFVRGGWCVGADGPGQDPCSVRGDLSVLTPTEGAQRLQKHIDESLEPENFRKRNCAHTSKWERVEEGS